jgi:hypothetical protein
VFDRMRDSLFGKKKEAPAPIRRTETPADLQRGDVVVFWEGGDRVVTATLDCYENINGRQTEWRWLQLDSGQTLEVLSSGEFLYEPAEVLYQGTVAFQRLTGSRDEQGVLQSFEQRVRDGTVATDPVSFRMDDAVYRVLSTGTFLARRTGPVQGEVWRDISDDEGQNVYVRMQASDGANVLGIWTTHIALMKGRPLRSSDIKGLYGA